MFKKKHFVGITVTALVTLLILALPTRLSLQLRSGLSNVFLPLFGLSSATRSVADEAALKLMPRHQLENEVSKLRQENDELRVQMARSEEVTAENARLRQQLGWQASMPWKLKLGRVVLRDPANWWRAVQIDLGSRDGVALNATVLTPKGLVGRISSVGFDHSQVVLLGDPSCNVSALVGDNEAYSGIIGSASALDGSMVEMTYLPRHAKIAPGTVVITSGMGGTFAYGIRIGQVVDTRPVEYGLQQAARIRLSANLSGLEEVWVVVQ